MALAFPMPDARDDLADIALCEAIKARNEPGVLHEKFMAELDAEDQGQPPA